MSWRRETLIEAEKLPSFDTDHSSPPDCGSFGHGEVSLDGLSNHDNLNAVREKGQGLITGTCGQRKVPVLALAIMVIANFGIIEIRNPSFLGHFVEPLEIEMWSIPMIAIICVGFPV